MPAVGFEPTIQLFERLKTVRGLDRAATVIGITANPIQSQMFQLHKPLLTFFGIKEYSNIKTSSALNKPRVGSGVARLEMRT
jgi:hypothetical protein